MKLLNIGHTFNYETEKLLRLFFPFEKIEVLNTECIDGDYVKTLLNKTCALVFVNVFGKQTEYAVDIADTASEDEKELLVATALFFALKELTGFSPKWGVLTGVRPAKLYSRLCSQIGQENTDFYFEDKLFVSKEKISLCKQSRISEQAITDLSKPDSFSLYISIPFCPTRCSYCSFVSHSVEKAGKLINDYVDLLCKEIQITAQIAKNKKLRLETVYMGGGTPTTLSAEQLNLVLSTVNNCFDITYLREFTVEAGRPDTITKEKLVVLKNNGVNRISINPQTMNDKVLKVIGRNHTEKQTIDAYLLAEEIGFDNINMDLIAGLPEDTLESFENTLNKVISLKPQSVTVHSLALKRASNLNKDGNTDALTNGIIADKMVSLAREKLSENGILPYYMYRQSKTVGNLENVGYSKKGYECLYNVYIMDETHTILACGASAVTKLKEPNGNYIERIFNFKYPYEYISRFDELINRKERISSFYEEYGK